MIAEGTSLTPINKLDFVLSLSLLDYYVSVQFPSSMPGDSMFFF